MFSSHTLCAGGVPGAVVWPEKRFCSSMHGLHCAAVPPASIIYALNRRNQDLCWRIKGNDSGHIEEKGLCCSSQIHLRRVKLQSGEQHLCRSTSSRSDAESWPETDPSPEAVATSERYQAWDAVTQKMTEFSVVFFVLLLMPQLIKNMGYLQTNQYTMIAALPWMGYTTGLLGNMLLLTYFTGKREGGAMTVQAVGVVATYLLISQIFAAGFMPIAPWAGLSALVLASLIVNYLSYVGAISEGVRSIWIDFQGGVGWAVLAQVLWSSFSAEPTTAPGAISTLCVAAIIILRRLGKLSQGVTKAWEASSAWIATLLFMFMPVPQLIMNLTQPSTLAGLSVSTNFLAMAGNCFMIPRALFLRDIIWLTGSTWGALVMGWGIIFSLYRAKMLPSTLFFLVSATLAAFLGGVVYQDAKAR